MFGIRKKEINQAEEVEILLGEEARYEETREGLSGEICPLLSHYGNYAVCSHLVNAAYAGYNYDYIYEIKVYPSETDRMMPAFHGSILKIYNVETYQKIYCSTEGSGFPGIWEKSGLTEQEKAGKLRVWTEGGRLYGEEVKMIELYQKEIKDRLLMDYAKEYTLYFDKSSMLIIFLKPKRFALSTKLNGVNVFLLRLEEKKLLTVNGKKVSPKENDFYCKELAKLIFGDTVQYRKKIEGDTGSIIPILAPYGKFLDCRVRIETECAGYRFAFLDYLNVSASAWDRKIHHWAYTGDGLVLYDVKTPERFCFSFVRIQENMKPFGFISRQKAGKLYLWTDGREVTQQEIKLANKYYNWISDTALAYDLGVESFGYFDGDNLNLFFREPQERQPEAVIFEDIRQAFQILRIRERKEQEKKINRNL